MLYDEAGRLTQIVRGESLTTDYEYYDWDETYGGVGQGGRLEAITTGTLQDLTYNYDSGGNIINIVDIISGTTETLTYTYDALNRLTSAQATGFPGIGFSETYSYDSQGRLDGLPSLGDYDYNDPDHAHTVTHIDSVRKYWYDPNGNMITRTVGTDAFALAYDPENRIAEVSGDAVVDFTYDGDGKMVIRTEGDLNTVYIGDHFEIDIRPDVFYLPLVFVGQAWSPKAPPKVTPTKDPWGGRDPYPAPGEGGEPLPEFEETIPGTKEGGSRSSSIQSFPPSNQTWRSYYYVGSTRASMRVQEGSWRDDVYFLLSDHLGSTSLTIENDGSTVASEMRYSPWGSVRYSNGITPTEYTYTGQRSETDSFGLMFYNARWYDPTLGRFIQPDQIIPEDNNPLDLDRYSYVRNNPIAFMDPSGRDPVYISGWNDTYKQLQIDNTCASTALAAGISVLLGVKVELTVIRPFFPLTYIHVPEINIGQRQIIDKIKGFGTVPWNQAQIASDLFPGISATYSQGDRAALLSNVMNDLPTVVSIAYQDLGIGHALLVVGYDPVTNEFL
jgi:RHS repeat-associated protein